MKFNPSTYQGMRVNWFRQTLEIFLQQMPFESFSLSNFISVSSWFKFTPIIIMDLPQKFNLHKHLKLDHSWMTLKRVWEWEKLERLWARFMNHLHFTLYCKHHNVTPVSKHIKTSVKGSAAKNIILKTQKSLMNVRIQEINNKIRTFKAYISDIYEELFILLPSNV